MRKISLTRARWQKLKRLLYCRHSRVASTGLKEFRKLEQANQAARRKLCIFVLHFFFLQKKMKITLFFFIAICRSAPTRLHFFIYANAQSFHL